MLCFYLAVLCTSVLCIFWTAHSEITSLETTKYTCFTPQLEEERMLMQQKVWETSQANERQFDQLHKLEARYDQAQQDYQKFRQEHRYCTPVSRTRWSIELFSLWSLLRCVAAN